MFTSDTSASSMGPRPDRREWRPAAAAPSLVDPVYIATSVWKMRGLILLCSLLGLAGAIALATVTPKIYGATAQILIDPRDIKVVANEVTPNGLPSEATLALVESQTSVILSSNVLSRVIAAADLENDPEFNGTLKTGLAALLPSVLTEIGARPDEALRSRELRVLDRLRRALTVEREVKSFVINLTVRTTDPQKSARLANEIAEVFIAEQGRVQSDTARRATDSLSSRLSELRQSVVEAEGRVEEYKSSNALIGVGGRLVDDDYIVRINDQLAKARGDITALRVRAESMREASVEDVVRGTLPEELSSAALVRLRQTYSDLAQQAAILGTKLGPRHPQRLAIDGALRASRDAIAAELGRIVSSAQTELARATETERNLTSQIDELKVKQVETSGSFVKLRELEREVDASRAVYEAFLLRARETSEQESLNTANVRVISDATVPLEPSGVSRRILVVAGLVLGFAIGVALAAAIAIVRAIRAADAPARSGSDERPVAFHDQEAPFAPVARQPGPEGGAALPEVVYHDVPAPPQPEAAAVAAFEAPSFDEPLAREELRASIHETGDALRRGPAESFVEAGPDTMPDAGPAAVDGGDLADDPAAAERRMLRERVRALSALGDGRPSGAPKAEVADLAHDIASIRATIAEIRRRKATSGGLA